MIRNISKWMVYGALLFLGWHIYQNDYLGGFQIHSLSGFLVAILLCGIGFIFMAYSWMALFAVFSPGFKFKDALAGYGSNIFSKYIPGKIWMLVSPAVYYRAHYNTSADVLFTVTIYFQLIHIWAATLLSLPVLYFSNDLLILKIITLLIFFATSALLFIPWFLKIFQILTGKIFRKKLGFENFEVSKVMILGFWFTLPWLFWMGGFYFVAQSINPEPLPFYLVFFFPLSTYLGVIAIFAPGGLGVREGVLVTLAISMGMSVREAVATSVFARLWFISGEAILFLIGILAHKKIHGK